MMISLKNIEKILLYLNTVIMLFISSLLVITSENIVKTGTSMIFFNSVRSIAYNVKELFLVVLFLLAVMIVLDITYQENKVLIVIIEGIIILIIVHLLGYNYNGIIMFFFVKVLSVKEDKKIKFILLAIGIIFYIITDQNLMLVNFKFFILEDYINFYTNYEVKMLTANYTVLKALNVIVFILYCTTYIKNQKEQINEINYLYNELHDANNRLEEMNNQLVIYAKDREKYGQIHERNRLAGEIHDGLGHMLTGLSYGLEAAITTIDGDTKYTKNMLVKLLGISSEGLEEVRRSVNALKPDLKSLSNLKDEIIKLILASKDITDINIKWDIDLSAKKYKEDEGVTIYRIIQEGITNCIKHSSAKNLYISVKEINSNLLILIKDDGVGCDKMITGFGTNHIKERVALLNGTVDFKGKKGFEINVLIPIRLGD